MIIFLLLLPFREIFFLNGPTRPLFCLFSFFSQCKDKYSTNLTINDKSFGGELWSQTRGGRMQGVDKYTEFSRHPFSWNLLFNNRKETTFLKILWNKKIRNPQKKSTFPFPIKIWSISVVIRQCDQIERFLKVLVDKYSFKSTQTFDDFLGYFGKNHFLSKNVCG